MAKKALIIFNILICNFIFIAIINVSQTEATSSNNFFVSFSVNKLLSESDSQYSYHVEPSLAIGSNNELFVGWKEANGHNTAGVDVSFTKSVDNGSSWTEPISMPSNVSQFVYKSDPWLQYFNGTLFYSYIDYSNNSNYSQITMAHSENEGESWSTTRATYNSDFADKEAFIVSENGTIFLMYDDVSLRTGLGDVILSKSIDKGKSFSETSILNKDPNVNILGPYPALSSNQTLLVAWLYITNSTENSGDVYYAISTDGGITFSAEKDLNPETDFYGYVGESHPGATLPVVLFDSNDRVYILWSEFVTNWRVVLKYSDDFGNTWSDKISINEQSNEELSQRLPDMAIDSEDSLHIVWYEEINSRYKPYYRIFSFTGLNHDDLVKSDIIPVADSFTSNKFTRPGDYCTIKVDSLDVPHIVWTDGRSDKLDIYYAYGSKTKETQISEGFLIPISLVSVTIFAILHRKKKK
jgi:hypothetical protein